MAKYAYLQIVNPLRMKCNLFYLKIQVLPRSKHSLPLLRKTNHLMLYRTKVVVFSEIHREHINANYGHNVEFLDIHPVGKESNR